MRNEADIAPLVIGALPEKGFMPENSSLCPKTLAADPKFCPLPRSVDRRNCGRVSARLTAPGLNKLTAVVHEMSDQCIAPSFVKKDQDTAS